MAFGTVTYIPLAKAIHMAKRDTSGAGRHPHGRCCYTTSHVAVGRDGQCLFQGAWTAIGSNNSMHHVTPKPCSATLQAPRWRGTFSPVPNLRGLADDFHELDRSMTLQLFLNDGDKWFCLPPVLDNKWLFLLGNGHEMKKEESVQC